MVDDIEVIDLTVRLSISEEMNFTAEALITFTQSTEDISTLNINGNDNR